MAWTILFLIITGTLGILSNVVATWIEKKLQNAKIITYVAFVSLWIFSGLYLDREGFKFPWVKPEISVVDTSVKQKSDAQEPYLSPIYASILLNDAKCQINRGIIPDRDTLCILIKSYPKYRNELVTLFAEKAYQLNEINEGSGAKYKEIAQLLNNLK